MYFRQFTKRKPIQHYKLEAKEDNSKKAFSGVLTSVSECGPESPGQSLGLWDKPNWSSCFYK